MALLRPSADIPHVDTQKDIYGLRFAHNTIDWLTIIHSSSIQLVTLNFFTMLSCIRDSSFIQLASHSRVPIDVICESMYSRVSLMISRESFAGCSTTYPRMCLLTFKHKTCANWRLVNSFNLISLTATTSPTFENCKYRPWGGCQ